MITGYGSRFRGLLHRRISMGISLVVLVCTLLLTLLFWKAVELDDIGHVQQVERVAELKFFHGILEREFEGLRSLRLEDSSRAKFHAGIVRDLGRQVTVNQMTQSNDGWRPSDSLLSNLWNATTYRVLLLERYLEGRAQLEARLDSLLFSPHTSVLTPAWAVPMHQISRGRMVPLPQEAPRSASEREAVALWEMARGQHEFYLRFRQVPAISYCDDIIAAYREQVLAGADAKRRLQSYFYVFSLLIVLALAALGVRPTA